jgi:TATA-box binding protein (TBP) (component of TFIID and TFIIIB)
MSIPDKIPEASELKVSTMVCLCLLNVDINLDILSRFVRVYPVNDDVITKGEGGIVYVEYFLLLPRGQYCGKKSQIKKKELQINAKLRVSLTNDKKYHIKSIGDMSYQEPDPSKSKKKRKKKKGKRQFENQATLIFHFKNGRYVNIKVFHNGKIQMTGVRSVQEATWVVSRLIEIIKETKVQHVEWKDVEKNKSWLAKNQYVYTKILEDNKMVDKVYRLVLIDQVSTWIEIPDETLDKLKLNQPAVLDTTKMKMTDYQTVMINSNYSLKCNIDRAKLQEILKKKYKIYSTFESTYQAVKSYFYFSKDKSKDINTQNGVCKCEVPCFILKELKKKTPMPCSQVTIAVFRTGSVIITGGSTIEQTKRAYDFINSVVHDNFKLIYQASDLEKDHDKNISNKNDSDPMIKLKKLMIERANENRRRVIHKKKAEPKPISTSGAKRGRKPKLRYINAFDIIDTPYTKDYIIPIDI